jgi:uncharacterized protein YhbP (UPF0306 family)
MTIDDVLALMERNVHCTIASASLEGIPWVSPVFFNYDASLRIVFESAQDSHHALLIAANPRVAIVVADMTHRGRPRGVYLEAEAREVTPARLEDALELFVNGPHRKKIRRTLADYDGAKPFRLLEAMPRRLFGLTQVRRAGYVVDERVEIPLPGSDAHVS